MSNQSSGAKPETDGHDAPANLPPSRVAASSARQRRWVIIILSVLLVIMMAISIVLLVKYRRETDSNPATRQQQLTDQLSQVAEMPPEQPVISSVLDRSKLTNPALTSRAKNGDQLFIFPKSKRLILYRPSTQKVVDMLNIQT